MSSELSRRVDQWVSAYPDTSLQRLVHRLPVPLWRLGLRRVVAGPFMVLSTLGRRSGAPVHTPLMAHRVDGSLYAWCPYGGRGQWWRNLLADPVVTVQDVRGTWSASAVRITDDDEVRRVHAELAQFDPALLRRYATDQCLGETAADFVAGKERLHLRRLDPSPGPSPAPLRADLLWAWPVASLAGLLVIASRGAVRRRWRAPSGSRPPALRPSRAGARRAGGERRRGPGRA